MKIESKLYSLAGIVAESPNWHFNIPIYQRLYVWGEDQILMLLNDLVNAYERKEDLFFLGGTLLVEQQESDNKLFDLIDGQQRFTTLWMLCYAWSEALKPFLTTTDDGATQARLKFAIRPEVNHFMEKLIFGGRAQLIPDEESTKRMRTALALMQSVFERRSIPAGAKDKASYLAGLTDFVFKNVKFVITTVPSETDLNKLFEVINNRGVQLQHHEILKARMLDVLTEKDRSAYAVLWDSCADMENFVERNFSGLSSVPAHEIAACYERKELTSVSSVIALLTKQKKENTNSSSLSLDDILNPKTSIEDGNDSEQEKDAEPTLVRSIFGFPLFLQHTLRVWLFLNNPESDGDEKISNDLPRLLDKELISLFESHFFNSNKQPENVKSFIDLLWQLRVVFDEHIIKWIDQGEEEVHLISNISMSASNGKRYMSRSRDTDSHRAFSLLQSMLYHSQEITTQYWLTPLLFFIYKNPNKNSETYFKYLRHLDNHLLGGENQDSLVSRTRSFMVSPDKSTEPNYHTVLNEPSGVKFAHYWFYKLEFVLWFQNKSRPELLSKFRLTAKSSVEHISPKTPTDRDENRVTTALDHFGNLALVSRSLNSEYGNLPYNEKRQRFRNKNKNRLDSLKMALIYENEQWDDEKAKTHQDEMIKCLDAYYQPQSTKE